MSFILYNLDTQQIHGRERPSRYAVDGVEQAPAGLLPSNFVELEIIEQPFPELSDDEQAARFETVDLQAGTLTRGWNVVPYERPVPPAVARQQLFQWLFAAKGITRAQVRAVIEANPDATAREVALIDFDEAQYIRRNHPLVAQLGAALGMTEPEIDEGFKAASLL